MAPDEARTEEVRTWLKHDFTLMGFEPSIHNYRPDWDPAALAGLKAGLMSQQTKKDGRCVEAFRKAASFNEM